MILKTSMDAVVNDHANSGVDFKHDPKFGAQMKANVSGTKTANDKLSGEIDDAVEAIEDFTRGHIDRK